MPHTSWTHSCEGASWSHWSWGVGHHYLGWNATVTDWFCAASYQEKRLQHINPDPKKIPKCSIQHLKQSFRSLKSCTSSPGSKSAWAVWSLDPVTIHHPVTILSPPRPVPADVWRALGKTSAHVQSPRAVPQSLPQRLNFRFGSINKSTSSDVWIFETTLHTTS